MVIHQLCLYSAYGPLVIITKHSCELVPIRGAWVLELICCTWCLCVRLHQGTSGSWIWFVPLCNWRRPYWGRNVLLSEAIYHLSYAWEPRNCLFIDVVMNLYYIIHWMSYIYTIYLCMYVCLVYYMYAMHVHLGLGIEIYFVGKIGPVQKQINICHGKLQMSR